MEKAPEVLVIPPLPKPRSEVEPPLAEVLEMGRAKTPAFETALPAESRTVPVMVLSAEESVKFTPVTFVVVAITVRLGGGMKVNVGGPEAALPGMNAVSDIAGPTPTLYVVFCEIGSEYVTALPVMVFVVFEKPTEEAAKISTEVPFGPVALPLSEMVLPPPVTMMFFVRLVAETVNGCGTELYVTVEEAVASDPGSMPTM